MTIPIKKSKWAFIPYLLYLTIQKPFWERSLGFRFSYPAGGWYNSWLLKDDKVRKNVGYKAYTLELMLFFFSIKLGYNKEYYV